MIDREARDELSLLAKRFIAGRITNFDYETNSPFSKDRVIEIVDDYLFLFCNEFKEHNLSKGDLPKTTKKELARILLFLNSDYEYEWPKRKWTFNNFRRLFRLTKSLQGLRIRDWEYHNAGDLSVWPFTHRKHMMLEASKSRIGLSLTLAGD